MHELGHVYYHNIIGNNNQQLQIISTKEMQNIIQQRNKLNNQAKLDYMMPKADKIYDDLYAEVEKWYETIETEENEKIISQVNFLTVLNGEILLKSSLLDAGLESSEINSILSDKEQLISILQEENKINKIYEYRNKLMRSSNEGLYALGVYSMINTIMQKETVHIGNKEYDFKYTHEDEYWLDTAEQLALSSYCKSYDELKADYFALITLGQQELMNDIRELVGDEID